MYLAFHCLLTLEIGIYLSLRQCLIPYTKEQTALESYNHSKAAFILLITLYTFSSVIHLTGNT